MIDPENIEKAIEIALSIKRQFNNPVEMSRRRDDWKVDMMKDQLDRIINILKGEEDIEINRNEPSTEGTSYLDSQSGILSEEQQ
jgi:hypothetical protein